MSLPAGGPLRCARFSPDGRRLAFAVDTWAAASSGRIAVFDVASRRLLSEWQTGTPVGAVRFASHDQLLAADWSGRVVRWSVSRQTITGLGRVAKDLVSAASFSADTRALEAVAFEILPPFQDELSGLREGPL